MAFNVPDLSTFAAGDTDYILKLNTDNTAIENALAAIRADLVAATDTTGLAFAKEFYERQSNDDPINGVLGSSSLTFEAVSSTKLYLNPNPVTTISKAVIGGKRCEVVGALEYDLTNLTGLTSGDTVYVGVDYVDPGSMKIAVSRATPPQVGLVLYALTYTTSSGMTSIRRKPRSLLWDNTLEQQQQVVPVTFTVAVDSGGGSPYERFVYVPFEHQLVEAFIGGNSIPTTNTSLALLNQDGSTTVGSLAVTSHATGDYLSLNYGNSTGSTNYFTDSAVTGYGGPAFSAQSWRLQFTHSGSHTGALMGLRVRPSFGVPVEW